MKTRMLIGLFLVLIAQVSSAKPFQQSTSHSTAGNYLAYPAMRAFIERMVQKGFDRDYLVQTFSRIQRDENILSSAASPAEAKPWHSYRPIFLSDVRIRAGVNFWNAHKRAI